MLEDNQSIISYYIEFRVLYRIDKILKYSCGQSAPVAKIIHERLYESNAQLITFELILWNNIVENNKSTLDWGGHSFTLLIVHVLFLMVYTFVLSFSSSLFVFI